MNADLERLRIVTHDYTRKRAAEYASQSVPEYAHQLLRDLKACAKSPVDSDPRVSWYLPALEPSEPTARAWPLTPMETVALAPLWPVVLLVGSSVLLVVGYFIGGASSAWWLLPPTLMWLLVVWGSWGKYPAGVGLSLAVLVLLAGLLLFGQPMAERIHVPLWLNARVVLAAATTLVVGVVLLSRVRLPEEPERMSQELWRHVRDRDWGFVDRTIRQLLVEALDDNRDYGQKPTDGRAAFTPQELAEAFPERFLEQAEDLGDLDHPYAQPRCRAWIIQYAQAYLSGVIDAANLPPARLDEILRTNWQTARDAVGFVPKETPETETTEVLAERVASELARTIGAQTDVPRIVNSTVERYAGQIPPERMGQFRDMLTRRLAELVEERSRA